MRVARPSSLRRPLQAGAVAALLATAAAACGTGGYVKGGDIAAGKKVFTTLHDAGHGQKYACATCHTLAAAGASGTIGPNLDDAFSADRSQHFSDSTIEQIVADQIRVPLQGIQTASGSVTPTGTPVMPAGLVHGKDLVDVAAFVARCAGNQLDPACSGNSKK